MRRQLLWSFWIVVLAVLKSFSLSFSLSSNVGGGDTRRPASDNHNPRHVRHVIPKHVAFICDGNSRWAQRHNLTRAQGHHRGADRLVDLLEDLQRDGVSYCTLYGFSTENWNRPFQEVLDIFQVMEETGRKMIPRLLTEKKPSIRVKILGEWQEERIPKGLRAILAELERLTTSKNHDAIDDLEDNTLTLCLAINYGGRQDILQATKKLTAAVAAGALAVDDITDETFSGFLSTADIPDPDLIVRTSGECRLSNFLLWNAAYSELYLTETLWPDFDAEAWQEALGWYQRRSRRYGSRGGDDDEIVTTDTSTLSITTQPLSRIESNPKET